MSASADAVLVQLNKWKSDSALLYLFFQGGGMTAWCIGVLSHVSSAELHFRMKHGDGQDLLFAMNIHTARFEWPDASDAPQFFATKPRGSFGKTLVMHLEPGGPSSTVKGRVALAEFYPETLNIN
jgi:hypothetical protein